jgi:hypothetical protein
MDWDDLSPEQQRHLEAEAAEFERQLARVNVDLRAASPHMHELEPPKRHDVADDENSYMITFTVDHSGILKTLRQLPDGAGTSAFVAAYNAAHPDWRDRPSNEP